MDKHNFIEEKQKKQYKPEKKKQQNKAMNTD